MNEINKLENTKIAIFRNKKIRKTIYKNEWWFVVNDVIEALTDSADPAQYFKRLKLRDDELAKLTRKTAHKGVVQIVPPLLSKLKLQVVNKRHITGIQRVFLGSFNPSHLPKQNHSSAG